VQVKCGDRLFYLGAVLPNDLHSPSSSLITSMLRQLPLQLTRKRERLALKQQASSRPSDTDHSPSAPNQDHQINRIHIKHTISIKPTFTFGSYRFLIKVDQTTIVSILSTQLYLYFISKYNQVRERKKVDQGSLINDQVV
jgi:hypothetical protein